jgi:broad specificity phosphatase PhoE
VIYLLRHGQTPFNAERRMQGHMDTPLNALGVRQAAAMGGLLRGLIQDTGGWRIVASPLTRAQDTAKAVGAALGLPVETDRRLIEVTVGEWEGRLLDDVAAEHPELFKSRQWFFHAPGGETYDQMAGRIGAWLGELPPEPDRKVIAVCHGVTSRVLRGLYLGLSAHDALQQDVPQDAIYRLSGGEMERMDCEPVS